MFGFKYENKIDINYILMGIDNLNKTIKETASNAITHITIKDLPKGIYGVDVSIYLYPGLYNKECKGKGSHIRKFMDIITTWRNAGHNLVMVFDGDTRSVKAKKATIEKRFQEHQKKHNEILEICTEVINEPSSSTVIEEQEQQFLDSVNINDFARHIINNGKCSDDQIFRLENAIRNNITVKTSDIQDLFDLFQMTNTPVLQAKGEADHLLAELYRGGLIDGVISEDSDMLTHGVNLLIRGLNDADCRRQEMVKRYDLQKILDTWGLTYTQFVDVCILSGCDYSSKIRGIACKTAINVIKKHGSVEAYLSTLTGKKMDAVPEGFLESYKEAVKIFCETNENIPYPITTQSWSSVTPQNEATREKFKQWLLKETNYTPTTLEKKLVIFQEEFYVERDVPKNNKVKVKIQVMVKPKIRDMK